jgi:hypothetical protein
MNRQKAVSWVGNRLFPGPGMISSRILAYSSGIIVVRGAEETNFPNAKLAT